MSAGWTRRVLDVGMVAILSAAAGSAACGGAKDKGAGASPVAASSGGTGTGGAGGGVHLGNHTLESVTIEPSSAAITVTRVGVGAASGLSSSSGAGGAGGAGEAGGAGGAGGVVTGATQAFQLVAHYSDGSTEAVTPSASWTSDQPAVGGVAAGLYTANGSLGGVVRVQGSYMGQAVTATLTVKLLVQENLGSVPSTVQTGLQGATMPDANVVWAYPYDGTVWPRGLSAPVLQWNGGAATDTYYVHIVSPTFELQEVTSAVNAPASQLGLSESDWSAFTDSTVGPAQMSIARWDGTTATLVTQQAWTISSASMRGTIYYWANNLGRVMRLDPVPGAAPVDFSVGQVPQPSAGAVSENQACTMACHTVAANGSAMTVAGGTFGGVYDLQANMPGYSVGAGESSPQIEQWGLAALSPKGNLVVTNPIIDALSGLTVDGVYQASNGTPVANSGLSSELTFMPTFSPDGSGFAFVTGSFPFATPPGGGGSWDSTGAPGPTAPTDPTWGWLKAYDFNDSGTPMFSNERPLVGPGTDPKANVIAWPTVSPDGNWVFYSRLGWVDPNVQNNLASYYPPYGDLYMASMKSANVEVRLANLDGDNTTFAAGSSDLHLNYEPSAAPVAAGGYFWVVFHSRRSYGNTLTNGPASTKQLWVAAIDQNPKPGVDPSHPAFRLPGQDPTSLNMRGFWSLPPCAQEGNSCATGTDCCSGYCTTGADGGAAVCQSMSTGCSQDGNACATSSDCCNTTSTCINHVCSEPTPQ